jgi:Reverse transcriptase (RNA-dependent DNA polymerase)
MYKKSLSCVQTEVGRSAWFSVNEGLRQGSVLSPTLFVKVMDELLQRIEPDADIKTKTLIYADDVALCEDSIGRRFR